MLNRRLPPPMGTVMTGSTAHRTLRGIWRRLAADAGTSLIEIVVAAALLGVVAVGVMSSLDVSARVSGSQKGKVVAGNVAEGEMERLRGLAIEDLQALNASPPEQRVVGGATYTITSRADWVSDAKGSEFTCAVTGGNTYMKLRTTVSWGANQQVKLDGIVSPGARSVSRTYGALAVRFVNSVNGAPIPGVSATLASSSGQQAPAGGTSDSNGCIVWNSVLAGTWTMTASKAGWITADEQDTLVRELNVLGADAVFNEYQLFQGARISGSFYSRSSVDSTNRSSAPQSYVVAGGGQTRILSIPAGQTTFQTPYLRSDVGDYKIYAGHCSEATLGGTVPGTYSATVPAGQTGVQVRLPAYDVLTQTQGGIWPFLWTDPDSMRTRFSACGFDYWRQTRASNPRMGRLDDPGYPWHPSSRQFCVDTWGTVLIFFPTQRRTTANVTMNGDTGPTYTNNGWPISAC
jgi:type II secretory pathway pseudopilin PulG